MVRYGIAQRASLLRGPSPAARISIPFERLEMNLRSRFAVPAGLFFAMVFISLGTVGGSVRSGGEQEGCPERCGEVLKACLDRSANRYHCIDVAEKCMTARKRGGTLKRIDVPWRFVNETDCAPWSENCAPSTSVVVPA